MPLPAVMAPTVESKVAGGHTRSSQPSPPPAAIARFASSRASAAPSSHRPFIFQLPATSVVPIAMLRPPCPVTIIRCLRSHRRAGGSTGPDPRIEAVCLHAPGDPLESGIFRRQAAVRPPDPDLRDLGDRRYLPHRFVRYVGRHGR